MGFHWKAWKTPIPSDNLRWLCHRALCLLFSTFDIPVPLNAPRVSFVQVPSLLGSLSPDYALSQVLLLKWNAQNLPARTGLGGRGTIHSWGRRQAGVLPASVFAQFSGALSSGALRSLTLSPDSFQEGIYGSWEFKNTQCPATLPGLSLAPRDREVILRSCTLQAHSRPSSHGIYELKSPHFTMRNPRLREAGKNFLMYLRTCHKACNNCLSDNLQRDIGDSDSSSHFNGISLFSRHSSSLTLVIQWYVQGRWVFPSFRWECGPREIELLIQAT